MKVFESRINPGDIDVISQVLARGQLGFGQNVRELEDRFTAFSQKTYNIAVNSASAAAFMIFAFLKEKYGECDVYTTSLGFASPAWAASHMGHNLIFVDVNDELQFDIEDYKRRYKPTFRQTVVMPVLYGGVSTIEGFSAALTDEIVVVDSAHCVTPTIEADYLFFSFHPAKPICTSDGGMISTHHTEAAEYWRLYRNFGRQARAESYDIVQQGFKFYMNNLNASIALTQLPHCAESVEKRKKNYERLQSFYSLLPHDEFSSYYFATTFVPDATVRLKSLGIARHYPMLHQTTYFSNGQTLPYLESLHPLILNLPIHQQLTESDFRILEE